ncbi:hypothetical protein HMPREF2955_03920 [Prevotella sp. HMSC073D09]|nr:hypothetical protein HMPREF2955_03920 [Prevotella sp. HMSC073D09]
MKKKTIVSLMFMLCLVAQQVAAAARFRIRVRGGGSDDVESGPLTWIIYGVVAIAILGGLYIYMTELKSLVLKIFGGLRMDDKTTLTKDQQRKMLLSSVSAAYDKVILNSLKTGMARTEREDYLKEHWDVDGHDSAINLLNDFKVACTKNFIPHIGEAFKLKEQQPIDKYLNDTFVLDKDARACAKQIENAFKMMPKLVKLGIVKDETDFVRIGADGYYVSILVYLARLCAECKYISEEEMWQYVDAADEFAHQSLTSWEDYGKSYLIGYALWLGSGIQLKMQANVVKKLIENPKSPWNSFPFAK